MRRQLVEEGFKAVLQRHPYRQKVSRKKVAGEVEAHLVALACSEAPRGRSRWSLRLLAERMVELGYVESVSHETVRRTLKKNELKPWLHRQWCIPPEANAAFVCAMEDVLSLYRRPRDPRRPLVCMDETSKQLIKETRQRIVAAPGRPARVDYEYERNGVCNLFVFCEPLVGRRSVSVTDRRTTADGARQIKELLDGRYPEAEQVTLVLDNLNTHTGAVLYEVFEPQEARRLLERLDIHYTPKHGADRKSDVGSTWPRSNWACLLANASTGALPTRQRSRAKSPLGNGSATPPGPQWTGASPRPTPESS